MNKKLFLSLMVLLIAAGQQALGQGFGYRTNTFIYKEVDGHSLTMTVYRPELPPTIKLPAIVFFFGGGWVSGDPGHFRLQAQYLASRGMVAVCPDYRTKNRHGTTPFESVKDARSAMRYLKINSEKLGIDRDRIVASGGSAGGHLAACTAIIDEINDESDDLTVSPVPFAMVLFNPVVDTGKRGYGQEKLGGREFQLSPVHNITSGVPPTLIMHGKADKTVPYENVVRFKQVMEQEGNQCRLKAYNNQEHGFFNISRGSKYFRKTLKQTEVFLESLGLLRGESWVNEYCRWVESREVL